MLNTFWLAPKRPVFTDYYFVHDTTGTIPDVYRFVSGNVFSTVGGIRFVGGSSIATDATVPVNLTNCTIEYSINCTSITGTVVVLSSDNQFFLYPTESGQLVAEDGTVYCQPGTILPMSNTHIAYTSNNGQFSVFVNGNRVAGPSPCTYQNQFVNRSIRIRANAYMGYFRIASTNVYPIQDETIVQNSSPTVSDTVFLTGKATDAITKRIISPFIDAYSASRQYTDNILFNPDGYREGVVSPFPFNTSWTGWANVNGYTTSLALAAPNGTIRFAAGTTDGSPQIVGDVSDGLPNVRVFPFSRSANTCVPISIHAYALSGLTVKLNETVPVTWETIQPVQFPERFKISPQLRLDGVDRILEALPNTILRDTTTGLYLGGNPLRLTTDVVYWNFTSNSITSSDGFSLGTPGYSFT